MSWAFWSMKILQNTSGSLEFAPLSSLTSRSLQSVQYWFLQVGRSAIKRLFTVTWSLLSFPHSFITRRSESSNSLCLSTVSNWEPNTCKFTKEHTFSLHQREIERVEKWRFCRADLNMPGGLDFILPGVKIVIPIWSLSENQTSNLEWFRQARLLSNLINTVWFL